MKEKLHPPMQLWETRASSRLGGHETALFPRSLLFWIAFELPQVTKMSYEIQLSRLEESYVQNET